MISGRGWTGRSAASSEEMVAITLREDYLAQRKWTYDPSSKTSEDMLDRFPRRHSCHNCEENIGNALRPTLYTRTFLRDVDSAIKAAEDNCLFYEWLLDFVIKSRPEGRLIGTEGLFACVTSLPGDLTNVHSIRFEIGTTMYSWPCATFDVFAEAGNAAASFISSRPFNRHVGSRESFRLARRWLATCRDTHDECRSSAGESLPTRLVDLRPGTFGNHSVRVISTKSQGFPRSVVYATLSYCWGGDQAITTSKSTLNRHNIGIKTSDLGQSLQDAIRVAQHLGLYFLWIDSLCIVQDDPQDVATEVSSMSEYYENALVCISAAGASSCNEGFLHTRGGNPYLRGPFELPYRGPNNSVGSVNLANYSDYSTTLEPVAARAWTMQESLLAPRVLSYSYRNLAWSCWRENISDGGPNRQWHDFTQRRSWQELRYQGERGKSFDYIINIWKDMVESYSKRSLTKPRDKFPAISGLAQKYSLFFSSGSIQRHAAVTQRPSSPDSVKYLAGMFHWGSNYLETLPPICLQLFWTTRLGQFRFSENLSRLSKPYYLQGLGGASVHRSSEYIAPSWSWGSIDGPVLYEDWGGRMSSASGFEVLDAEVAAETQQAPFGAVRSGWLTIKGCMRKVVPSTSADELGVIYRPDTEEDNKELYKVMTGKMQGWLLVLVSRGGVGKPREAHWTPDNPKGLILVTSGSNYRRIGLFSIENVDSSTQVSKEALESFFNEPRTITII